MTMNQDTASESYTDDFDQVFDEELKRIGKTRQDSLTGLGISGGGIRSASFGLGVLQALHRAKKIKDLDYLSSVSGGGYVSSSFTWFRHLKKGGFPFGEAGSGGRLPEWMRGKAGFGGLFPMLIGRLSRGRPIEGQQSQSEPPNAVLDYIRQHGNYLTPTPGINGMSLFGVVMRGMIVSVFVYVGLLTSGFTALIASGAFEPRAALTFLSIDLELNVVLWGALLGLGGIAIWALLFSARTWFQRIHLYRWVRVEQALSGQAWSIVTLLAGIGLIPVAISQAEGYFNEWSAGGAGIIGALMGFLEFRSQHSSEASHPAASAARVTLGALAMVYGVLMGAYLAAYALVSSDAGFLQTPLITAVVVFGAVLVFGILVDTNQSGLHRMYRDRLMETFMPDQKTVLAGAWAPAIDANVASLTEMCAPGTAYSRPYHLVNANVVLVDSSQSKYRDRGGDNFILAPAYCGSDATGWRRTEEYHPVGGTSTMTLATAMAISGAAVSPHTGVGGRGPSRGKLMSMLMTILKLRLGFWARNPVLPGMPWLRPNYISPGLFQGLLGRGFTERKNNVELTDGGHFENLALYELARRKLSRIIIGDAGADKDFEFTDLANAVEKIRVDFGYAVEFHHGKDLGAIVPGSGPSDDVLPKEMIAERGYAMATIWYDDEQKGELWYVKSTLVGNLPADLVGYKKSVDDFPDQSTSDQFFGERQFEAYRELGYQLVKRMLQAEASGPEPAKALPASDCADSLPDELLAKRVGGGEGPES